MSSSTQYSNMEDHNEIDVSCNNQEDNAYRRRSSSLPSGDDTELKDTTAAVDNNNETQPILSYTDYGQRRPARRSSRYTNNKQQQHPPQSTLVVQSSPLDSAQAVNEDTNTSSFSTNNTMSDKKRESWQINTDWDYNDNYDNSFTSQASLYHVLDELDEEQSDEYVDETKQTPNEEEVRGDNPTEELDKRINNIGEEFELPIQFKSNGSSSDISTTFSKPVRNNNNTSTGSLQSNHETRRSDSNRSFGSKGSSKGINVPRGRYSIDANDDFGSLLLLNNNNMNKKGLLSKAQTQSLRSINNNSNSGGGGENKTYKRSVQDTLRHDEGLASSIFSRNSDYSLGSVSASDRSGSGNIFGSGGTNMTSTANESWTASNTSSGGAGERLNELDEYWSGTNLRKSQVKQQHVEPWTIEGSDRRRNMNNVFDDLVLDDTNKKE